MNNKTLVVLVAAIALAACCLAGGAGALWAYGRGLLGAGGESTPASEAEVGPTSEALTEPAPAPSHPEQIAFLSYRDNPEGITDIYLMNTDGSGSITTFAWSPDGQRLAFESDRSGSYHIYVIQADGSGLARLTE